MHCELVVPSLFAAGGTERLPALELLLARGRESGAEGESLEEWLAEAFGLEPGPLAAGALTVLAEDGDPGHDLWSRADPVHLRLMRDRLALVPSEGFTVTRAEAEALCDALSRHFAPRLTFHAFHPERWCARLDSPMPLPATSSLAVAGSEVRPDPALDTLIVEAQMLLHAHPVNQARETRGEAPVNSVWLWGAGRAPAVAPSNWQSVRSDEPLALGLARLARTRHGLLPDSADAWLDRAPLEGRHLFVLAGLRAPRVLGDAQACASRLRTLEERWFEPLLAALRAGRVGMVTVHVPDGPAAASFETVRGDLRRFWRRPKAIERYA